MGNMEIWDKLKTPPEKALKKIQGGRLKGMTDISPQWRYQMMTEVFGLCGVGWKYKIEEHWVVDGTQGQKFCFVKVSLYVKVGDSWSEPIPGTGGHQLITQETRGLHDNDEGFKMATTDALSVAMKMLGMGADVYMGMLDGSKYSKPETNRTPPDAKSSPPITDPQRKRLYAISKDKNWKEEDVKELLKYYGFASSKDVTKHKYQEICDRLEEGPLGSVKPDHFEALEKAQSVEEVERIEAIVQGEFEGKAWVDFKKKADAKKTEFKEQPTF